MGASAPSPKVAVRPQKDYSDIEVYRVNVKISWLANAKANMLDLEIS